MSTLFSFLSSVSIENIRFSCEYLKWLKHDLESVKFIGDAWSQKHGINCSEVSFRENWSISTGIGIPVAVAAIIFGSFSILFLYKQLKKNGSKASKMSKAELVVSHTTKEHIYEEIGPSTLQNNYDQLQFEAIPLSITDGHYYHISHSAQNAIFRM